MTAKPALPSQRQIDILDRHSHGQTGKQIGRALHMSEGAVHREMFLLRKLIGAKSMPHAIRIGLEAGLIRSSRRIEGPKEVP